MISWNKPPLREHTRDAVRQTTELRAADTAAFNRDLENLLCVR